MISDSPGNYEGLAMPLASNDIFAPYVHWSVGGYSRNLWHMHVLNIKYKSHEDAHI